MWFGRFIEELLIVMLIVCEVVIIIGLFTQ